MNKNSNTYIIVYATILVVLVAAVLAYASSSLKDKQQANILIEKKGAILASFGQGQDADKAPEGKDAYINAQYDKYIKATYFVDSLGNATKIDDPKVAIDALGDLPAIFKAKTAIPVFEAINEKGATIYVVPVTGKGLWGPIWGYIAIQADGNTVDGAVFDHKGETPGLGAEIASVKFQSQFVGKSIFEADRFVSVTLTKGKDSSKGNSHAVDAVSGGTLTSNGVRNMLRSCLGSYVPYFEKIKRSTQTVIDPVDPNVEDTAEDQTQEMPQSDTEQTQNNQ